MKQKLTEGAQLVCNKGSKPSELKVSSQNFCKAGGKLVATEADIKPHENILPFGGCSISKVMCMPSLSQWDKPTPKDKINTYKVLTEDSYCQCTIGGKITVKHKGHKEQHEVG